MELRGPTRQEGRNGAPSRANGTRETWIYNNEGKRSSNGVEARENLDLQRGLRLNGGKMPHLESIRGNHTNVFLREE